MQLNALIIKVFIISSQNLNIDHFLDTLSYFDLPFLTLSDSEITFKVQK